VGRLENDISSIKSDVTHILASLEKVADRVNQPTVTNWGWIVSGVSVLLVFIATLIGPLYSQQTANRAWHQQTTKDIKELTEDVSYSNGYMKGLHDVELRSRDK